MAVFPLISRRKKRNGPWHAQVAWNTEIPDMLCFSAHGTLSISEAPSSFLAKAKEIVEETALLPM